MKLCTSELLAAKVILKKWKKTNRSFGQRAKRIEQERPKKRSRRKSVLCGE